MWILRVQPPTSLEQLNNAGTSYEICPAHCNASHATNLAGPEPTRPGHVACKTRFGLDQSTNPPPDDGLIRYHRANTPNIGNNNKSRLLSFDPHNSPVYAMGLDAPHSSGEHAAKARTNTAVTAKYMMDTYMRYVCTVSIALPRDQPMTTRRAPELYSLGNYYAAAAAPCLHPQGAPDPISRPPWGNLSPATNS